MVSLIELIEKGKLPLHQFMDLETVNWIKENRPSFNNVNSPEFNLKNKIDKYVLEIKKYIPSPTWFLVSKKKDSIHGMRHIIRVIFHSLHLSSLNEGKSSRLFTNSLVASSLHDLRRKNDLMDMYHGKRAARWFKKNTSLIENQYEIHLSQKDIKEIYYSISFHDLPYDQIVKSINYEKYKDLTDILKTADALDRYRLPSIRLWFKDKYVFFIPPDYLKCLAYQIVITSETNFLNGLTNVNSVLAAIEDFFK
ncbi:hypothetical protein ES703_124278 [subsurface metagenome]